MTDDRTGAEAEASRLHTELLNVVHAWETQRNRADKAEAELAQVQEQIRVARLVHEDEVRRAAREAMDAERRSWESRRAVDNVVLADLRRELAALKADAIPVARALLAYQLAVATTGIRKDAPSLGDRDTALRITALDTSEETTDGR